MVCTTPHALSPDNFSPNMLNPPALSPHALSPDTCSPDVLSPRALSPHAFCLAGLRNTWKNQAFVYGNLSKIVILASIMSRRPDFLHNFLLYRTLSISPSVQ